MHRCEYYPADLLGKPLMNPEQPPFNDSGVYQLYDDERTENWDRPFWRDVRRGYISGPAILAKVASSAPSSEDIYPLSDPQLEAIRSDLIEMFGGEVIATLEEKYRQDLLNIAMVYLNPPEDVEKGFVKEFDEAKLVISRSMDGQCTLEAFAITLKRSEYGASGREKLSPILGGVIQSFCVEAAAKNIVLERLIVTGQEMVDLFKEKLGAPISSRAATPPPSPVLACSFEACSRARSFSREGTAPRYPK